MHTVYFIIYIEYMHLCCIYKKMRDKFIYIRICIRIYALLNDVCMLNIIIKI